MVTVLGWAGDSTGSALMPVRAGRTAMRDFPRSFQLASGVVVDLDQSRGLNVKVNDRDARSEVRERL
jgi:hypothetical protein